MENKGLTLPDIQKLTAPDLRCRKFIELKNKISELNEELNVLKEEFKHQGTFSTQHYVCTVKTCETTTGPGIEVLRKTFGPSVEKLFKKGTRTTVDVTVKGSGE